MTAKSLKANSTRRAAKPKRKRSENCPVERLGRENDRLYMELRTLDGLLPGLSGNDKKNAERAVTMIYDKMRTNRIASTYLEPRSKLGAAFLLMSVYSDCKSIASERGGEGDTESFRRAERALYALNDWFFYKLDVSVGSVAGSFYMPRPHNPHGILRPIMAKVQANGR